MKSKLSTTTGTALHHTVSGHGLPRVVRGYWAAFVGLEVFALAIALYFRLERHIATYPYGNPIFWKANRAIDLMCAAAQFQHFHEPSFWSPHWVPLVYPAPMALMYEVIFGSSHHPVNVVRAFLLLAVSVAAYGFIAALIRKGISRTEAWAFTLSALVFSYPFQLLGWLLNLEIFVWIILSLGLWAYVKEQSKLAAVCFGIAGAMKIFPLIYLGLPLARKHYREVFLGVLVCGVSILMGTWVLGPTFSSALHGQAAGLKSFKDLYILFFNPGDNGINHSLFGLIKVIFWETGNFRHIQFAYRAYLGLSALLGLTLYLVRIRFLPQFNQVLLLAIASVLLPPVSHDYTLVHLYAPLVMLILFTVEQTHSHPAQVAAFLGCFAMLFTAQPYLNLHGLVLAAQWKALALVALFLLGLLIPLGRRVSTPQGHLRSTV